VFVVVVSEEKNVWLFVRNGDVNGEELFVVVVDSSFIVAEDYLDVLIVEI
jgi:hypothetical protein